MRDGLPVGGFGEEAFQCYLPDRSEVSPYFPAAQLLTPYEPLAVKPWISDQASKRYRIRELAKWMLAR